MISNKSIITLSLSMLIFFNLTQTADLQYTQRNLPADYILHEDSKRKLPEGTILRTFEDGTREYIIWYVTYQEKIIIYPNGMIDKRRENIHHHMGNPYLDWLYGK